MHDDPSTAPPGAALAPVWRLFGETVALSLPLWALGAATSRQLLPGLPASALMFVCPALAAAHTTARTGGRPGLRRLLARVADLPPARWWPWAAVSAGLLPGVLLAAYGLMRAAGRPLPPPEIPWGLAPGLFAIFLVSAACEELAFSALALAPLRGRYGDAGAALIIGGFWALWHAVPYLQGHPEISWVLGQGLFTLAFRVLLVWLFRAAGDSVAAVIIAHAAYNTAWQLFPARGSGYDPWVAAGLTGALILAGALVTGRRAPAPDAR